MCATTTLDREVAVLLPSDPALDRLPDPIPASYYARPAPAARTVPSPPGLPGAEPPARGLRGWPARALAAVACLLGVAWAVQLPWRPLLGLLGLLTIAAALLVADVGGVRRMVPLLRSPDPRRLRAGWAAVGGLLLLTGALALAVPGQLPLTGQRASHGSAGARTGGPAATAPSPAVPAPVAATPLPTSSPSPTASPPASGVTFLNAPLAAQRGQTVVLRVQSPAGPILQVNTVRLRRRPTQ